MLPHTLLILNLFSVSIQQEMSLYLNYMTFSIVLLLVGVDLFHLLEINFLIINYNSNITQPTGYLRLSLFLHVHTLGVKAMEVLSISASH